MNLNSLISHFQYAQEGGNRFVWFWSSIQLNYIHSKDNQFCSFCWKFGAVGAKKILINRRYILHSKYGKKGSPLCSRVCFIRVCKLSCKFHSVRNRIVFPHITSLLWWENHNMKIQISLLLKFRSCHSVGPAC